MKNLDKSQAKITKPYIVYKYLLQMTQLLKLNSKFIFYSHHLKLRGEFEQHKLVKRGHQNMFHIVINLLILHKLHSEDNQALLSSLHTI